MYVSLEYGVFVCDVSLSCRPEHALDADADADADEDCDRDRDASRYADDGTNGRAETTEVALARRCFRRMTTDRTR